MRFGSFTIALFFLCAISFLGFVVYLQRVELNELNYTLTDLASTQNKLVLAQTESRKYPAGQLSPNINLDPDSDYFKDLKALVARLEALEQRLQSTASTHTSDQNSFRDNTGSGGEAEVSEPIAEHSFISNETVRQLRQSAFNGQLVDMDKSGELTDSLGTVLQKPVWQTNVAVTSVDCRQSACQFTLQTTANTDVEQLKDELFENYPDGFAGFSHETTPSVDGTQLTVYMLRRRSDN